MSAKALLEESPYFGDSQYYAMAPLEEGLFGQVDLKHGQLFKVLDGHYISRKEGGDSHIPWIENQFGILSSKDMDEHPFKMGYFLKLNSIGEWVEPGMRIQTFDAFYAIEEPKVYLRGGFVRTSVKERLLDTDKVFLLGTTTPMPLPEALIRSEYPTHEKHWRPIIFVPVN